MPDTTSNRLTDTDRAAIRGRMVETVAGWGSSRTGAAHETLVRAGLGAIGCGRADMRDVELDEVEAVASEVLAEVAP